MKPEEFLRTAAWAAFDDCLFRVAEICEQLQSNPKYPGKAGVTMGVAMQLFLAEKILKEFGEVKVSLEPLVAEFRSAEVLAQAMVNESSDEVH